MKRCRWIQLGGRLLLGLVLSGCASAPRATTSPALEPLATPASPVLNLTPPPGLPAGQVMPRTGQPLQRAWAELPSILKTLTWPPTLADLNSPTSRPTSAPTTAATSPSAADTGAATLPSTVSPEAQKAYLRARQAWLSRLYYEAIRQAQAALRLLPDDPQLLRFLGRVYFDSGNPQEGQALLLRSLQVAPPDSATLLLLGRNYLQEGRDDLAMAYLASALHLPQDHQDDGQTLVVRYYLGSALLRQGYDAAAVAQFEAFLDGAAQASASTRYVRELFVLGRVQRAGTLLKVGDAYLRLDQPDRALECYLALDLSELVDPTPVRQRLVFTSLRLGQPAAATAQVMAALADDSTSDAALRLLDYLIAQRVESADLAARLEKYYEKSREPAELAVRMSRLLPSPAGLEVLSRHLAAHPSHRLVLAELLARALAPVSSSQAPLTAIQVTARTIDALPAAADAYADLLVAAAKDVRHLERLIRQAAANQPNQATYAYLLAMVGLSSGHADRAEARLRQALSQQPDFAPARIALAGLLLDRDQPAQADQWLEPLGGDPRVLALRCRVFQAKKQFPQALGLLDQLIRVEPDNSQWPIQKAQLQLELGRSTMAASTLLQALRVFPDREDLYQAYFDLLASPQAPPDAARQWLALLESAQRNIPRARVTRLQTAVRIFSEGRHAEAEAHLRTLISEDPSDLPASVFLLRVLAERKQFDEVETLLFSLFSRYPRNAQVQGFTLGLTGNYLQLGRTDDAARWLDRLGKSPLASPVDYLHLLGKHWILTGHRQPLDAAVRDLIRRYPADEPDLIYHWAMTLTQIDRTGQAEPLLASALVRFPDHADLNNALGYSWVDKGIRLAQGRAMIEKALASDPDNPAYLDSLGWACYKQGQFRSAADYLQRAVSRPGGDHPLLLNHLADALYQLGDHARALEFWQLAMRKIDPLDAQRDPEIRDLPAQLSAKIHALESGQPAPVAPSAGPASEPSDGALSK
ncbi:MAG: tetratricopeptide repeat protein [Phycisphaeraceae bacterium]|nr:tetratricopeptide repeat protein [Phycisphaeraceae bacterium]